MYDDTSKCSPLRDEVLECFIACNIFETKTSKDDHCEHEEVSYTQECDTSDEDCLVTDVDGNDDYWTFIENPIYETFENRFENPIYDMPREGSVDLETLGDFGMKGECSNFPYDYSEPYTSISNKDLEKEYNEDLDWVQFIESQLSSSCTEVPYDLE